MKKQVSRTMDPDKNKQGNTTVCEHIFNFIIFFFLVNKIYILIITGK